MTGKLKNFLLKAVGGPELEVNAEVGASQKKVQQWKHIQAAEQKLAAVISALESLGKPILFTDVGEAARAADMSQASVFVNIRERFDAPQFQSTGGVTTVNNDGYLVLEVCGTGGYYERDDYYKRHNRIVTLSASILKMPTSARGMAATGHDAQFFRRFGGRDIPLGVFGALTATPSYFQIKPYAIWR